MSEPTRNVRTNQQMQMRAESGSATHADRMANVAFVASLRGAKLREAAKRLSAEEVMVLVGSPAVSKAVRIALISRLEDAELLVDIATSEAEPFARRNALERLDVLAQEQPLASRQLERLAACLLQPQLIAQATALMDAAGFDWCARCDERVADSMCAALYNCTGIQEEVLIDDAFAQLAHRRPDLAGSLRACSPERFLPQALQPHATRTITLVDVSLRTDLMRCDDVA